MTPQTCPPEEEPCQGVCLRGRDGDWGGRGGQGT